MRTLSTAAAAARAAGAQADFVRVKVKDGGGTWRDLTTYAGANVLKVVNWTEGVSDPHATADVTLLRELFKLSFSPFIAASAINKGFDHTATADPLLQLNREFTIEAAVVPVGKQPDEGDYLVVFHGRIDNIDPGGADLKFGGRDLAGRLADQQIKKELVYALAVNGGAAVPLRPWEPGMTVTVGEFCLPASRGSGEPGENSFHGCITAGTTGNTEPVWDTTGTVTENDGSVQWQKIGSLTSIGVALEQAIQNIISTSRSATDALVTLYTPTSPGWAIKEFLQSRDKCLVAIRTLAQQIGWDVRMKWHEGTAAFRLTLFEPDRAKTTADATFSTSQYLTPSKFEVAIDNIRNAWTIRYSDSGDLWPDGSPKRKAINVSDSASIAKYGELWAEIQEATASNIDSSTEATKMVNAALADCSEPTADFSVELAGGFPWSELGDLYAFDPDGRTFDTQQKLAVTKWSQSFSAGKLKTSLEVRGKPSMGAGRWISVTTIHPVLNSAAGLFGDGRKVAPPASLFSGITTVRPIPIPTPGGLDVVLEDAAVDKLREMLEYEVHVHGSDPAFVPDSTTLKAITTARRVTIQGFTGGEEANIKVVPRSLSRGRMVRGQPSGVVTVNAGKVAADLVDFDLDAVADGATFARVKGTQLNGTGIISTVGSKSVSSLFQKAIDSLDSVLDSATFRRVGAGYVDASNRITALWNGSALRAVTDFFDKTLNTLDNVANGSTYARTIAADLSSGRVMKVGVAGASTKVLKAAADGTLSAAQVDSTMVDSTVALASDTLALAGRVDALELSPGAIPLNGDFEAYSSPNFDHWTVTAGTISSGTDSEGRYLQLNSSGDVYSAMFALPVLAPLTLALRFQATATGSGVSAKVRWYDRTQTYISTSTNYGTSTAANTWETTSVQLTPPTGARFAIIELKYEANTPKVQWVTLFSTPLVASATQAGIVDLNAQRLGAGEKSADAFKGTSANSNYAIGGGSPAAQVLRAESTSSIGQAVLDFYVNGARKGLIRGDYAGNITADVLTAFYVLVNGASIHQADSAGLRPGSDNSLTCGRSGARWSAVWAATGTIQTSDAADKVDVEDTPLGLDFVLQLKPRSWRWRVGQRELVQVGTRIETIEVDGKQEHHEVAVWEEREVPGRRRHHGFVVQEVVAALEKRGVSTEDFAAVVDPSVADAEDASAKGLRYDQLIAPLTRAVQELSQKLDAALQRIADLEQKKT